MPFSKRSIAAWLRLSAGDAGFLVLMRLLSESGAKVVRTTSRQEYPVARSAATAAAGAQVC